MTRTASSLSLALLLGLATAMPAAASERLQHYEALEAETLEQAVSYFSDYNKRLSEVLGKQELTVDDMEAVHELTYTLENALAKMRGDMAELAETLEALHLASEDHEAQATRQHGAAYLGTAQTLVP